MESKEYLYKNLHIHLSIDESEKPTYHKNEYVDIVNKLRSYSYQLDGSTVNQNEYCLALIQAFKEKFILDIDEFAFLYLKVCLACDYKTIITTNTLLNNCVIDNVFFKHNVLPFNMPSYGLDFISFCIDAKDFNRDRLVTYELCENSVDCNIPLHKSNIPLSDYIKITSNQYQIRISSFTLMKLYLNTYHWLPEFKYRFGIATKDDIVSDLQDYDTMGREINLWSPYKNSLNYQNIHGYHATTSIVTLHDIIHMSILSSYPKKFVDYLYKNVCLMTNNFTRIDRWNAPSLNWRLMDFSVSHEGLSYDGDLTKLLSIYIKKTCSDWFSKIKNTSSLDEKYDLILYYFKDLIIQIKKQEFVGFNLLKLLEYLEIKELAIATDFF